MIFQNKYRIPVIIITSAIILAGCFYASLAGPLVDPKLEDIVSDSENVGREIDSVYSKVVSSDGVSIVLEDFGYEYTAYFPEAIEVKPNDDVSFSGTIISPGFVKITDYHLHKYRAFKYFFSLPALAFVVYLLFRKYKFDWRRFMFIERKKKQNA